MAACGSGRSTTHAVDMAAMASDASNGADARMVVLRAPADWLPLLDDVEPDPRRVAQRKPSLPPWLVAQLVDEWRPCVTTTLYRSVRRMRDQRCDVFVALVQGFRRRLAVPRSRTENRAAHFGLTRSPASDHD